MPIVKEAKKRNIKVNFFCDFENTKYSSINNNKSDFNLIIQNFDIQVFEIKNIRNRKTPLIIIENVGLKYLNPGNQFQKIYSITYSGDFIQLYDQYVDKVSNIFMMSKYFAEYYKCLNKKNIYCGIPKFDVKYNSNEIYSKYNLSKLDKYALILYPRKRDLKKINLEKIYSVISDIGFKILVKTRGKDPVLKKKHFGDFLFLDDSWFPYTSLELIYLSNIVINFGSSAIEECVMFNTPMLDFDIKPPGKKFFHQLYKANYAKVLKANANKDCIKKSILSLTNNNYSKDFKNSREKYLFKNNFLSSSNILDFIMSKNKI